ncbi:ABC transporter permease [Neoaquamicrobium sediminum]|uniref:ABC transporter permease n=1 Tax=Neoaquamicrobium sediminum TaxID=1849104 RepID=UPI001567BD50|nr:ABC transporter permease [Mesorhizobium sediminum]NRC57344.1 ABC transporter permease [Mesorhizobium sediminum]
MRARRWSWIDLCTPAAFVIFVASWELICDFWNVSALLVPPPSQIALALWQETVHGALLYNLGVTLFETAVGFAIAAALGIGLGAIIAEVDWFKRAVYPYLIAFQTVPKIAIAPLLVLWFGFGMTSKIVIAVTIAVFPILINTIEGIWGTDRDRIDMVRAMRGSRWQVFWVVKFPTALPFIFAGLNVGIVFSLLGAVVGEFIGAQAGIGNLLIVANFRMDIATVFAVLVTLGVTGYALHLLMALIQRKVVFWGSTARGQDYV